MIGKPIVSCFSRLAGRLRPKNIRRPNLRIAWHLQSGLPEFVTTNPLPASKLTTVGEFYWGYGSGVVAVKVPDWGEFVLAEMTQTFDQADTTYFFPLMEQVEQRLGFRPLW